MNGERHQRVKEIFLAASDLEAGEREGFLDEACAADADLRAEIEQLLVFEREEPDFMQESPAEVRGYESVDLEAMLQRLEEQVGKDGRYEIMGEFARGGMGAILRVWDRQLDRPLAMKVVLGQGESPRRGDTPEVNERTLGRFLEEAQITGQLDHPGIVPVHELGLDADRQVYFTMKLVEGRDLETIFELLATGREDWTRTRALGVLLKVCEAMAYAHSKQVIHRDLKPANVMVGSFGQVYVMDWGLAHVIGQDDKKDIRVRPPEAPTEHRLRSGLPHAAGTDSPLLTMDGDVVGTPAYMSPEQARGDIAAMGPASDVYSLGAILYQLLVGHRPYVPTGARVSALEVWARVQQGPPTSVARLAPRTSEELVAICEKAMAREPSARYPAMGEMAEDLQAYLEGRVVKAHRTGAVVELQKWTLRNKALAASILVAVAGLAAVAYVQTKGRAAERSLNAALRVKSEEARTNATTAMRRADEVMRLSLAQDYDDLIEEADALWPAHPDRIPEYESWIERMQALVDQAPDFEAKREELRRTALPQDEQERIRERESHPDLPRLAALEAELGWRESVLRQRRDGVEAEAVVVDWPAYPSTAAGLNDVAWGMIDPGRSNFGEEPHGLALARRAFEMAAAEEKGMVGDTLAWALFAMGRDDEALKTGSEAVEAAAEGDRERYKKGLARLKSAVQAAASVEGLAGWEKALEELREELTFLKAKVNERRDWRFPAGREYSRWWNNQLTQLLDNVASVVAARTGLLSKDGIDPDHGWSVPRRLAFAEKLRAGFAVGGNWAVRWEEALPAIQKAHPTLDLTVQMGLVPLGPDPDSALWEFWHVQSGEEPRRGGDGKLEMEEASGLVFVLLPGGEFWMGASRNRDGHNYYEGAGFGQAPVHEVVLSPFFLSRYEMSQGQWKQLAGSNPSQYGPDAQAPYSRGWNAAGNEASLLLPVEQVTWQDCMTLLPRSGLILPSEAQWEYGARGGAETAWWSGSKKESLRGVANLLDVWARDHGGSAWGQVEEWLNDGYSVHAPVDTLLPNAFGLHHVHGNEWEWCLDGYQPGFYAKSPLRDPVSPPGDSPTRVMRGGCFIGNAGLGHAANRFNVAPTSADSTVGVRPARAITR